jgi:hypothetical protein
VTSANLELVKAICEARERGEYESADWADPAIEYVFMDGPNPAVWKGREELARGTRDFLAASTGFHLEIRGYRELDDERVLLLMRFGGTGKGSGVDWATCTD